MLGNCVIRELLAQGEDVKALCRKSSSRQPFADLDIEVVEGELGQADLLRRAAKGCRAIVHSAALIHLGWTQLAQSRLMNVEGTRHVVEACLANDAKLIHISTVDTFPAAFSIDLPICESSQRGVALPACNYVISKREADEAVRCAVREQQLQATIVHPGFMLGPNDWKPSSGRLMLGVVRAPLAIAPTGGCSLCDSRDVASGIVHAIDRGQIGQSYIMAGLNIPYSELWTRILYTAGKSRKVISPGFVLRLVGLVTDAVVKTLPIAEGDINSASIKMGQLFHYYDSTKAQRELGYRNRNPEETLIDAWNWLRNRFSRTPGRQ